MKHVPLIIILSSVFFATLFFTDHLSFEMYDKFHEIDRAAIIAKENALQKIPPFENTVDFDTIALPEKITSVHRIAHDEQRNRLLFVARHGEEGHGLWAYQDGEAVLLLEEQEALFDGHLFIDKSGNIFYHVNAIPTRLYRSEDGGLTWTTHIEKEYIFWDIADAGNGVLYGTSWSTNNAHLFKSIDAGKTWSLWKDFQQIFPEKAIPYEGQTERFLLRHLHSVIALDDRIIVATGDHARWALESRDDGESWREIWGEGFTSYYHDEEKNAIILGGDRNHSWGMAYYPLDDRVETAIDTWAPETVGWPGYVFSVDTWNDKYYAAVHVEVNDTGEDRAYGILVSDDGLQWERFVEFHSDMVPTELYLVGTEEGLFFSHNGGLFLIKE